MFGRKRPMIIGYEDKGDMRIKQGYNVNEDKFYFQMTEIKLDKNGKKVAGQEMRIYVNHEFFKSFHGQIANITYKGTQTQEKIKNGKTDNKDNTG